MNTIRLLAWSCMFAGIVACRDSATMPASPPQTPVAAEVPTTGEILENGRLVFRFDTGDREDWPVFNLPLEHRFDDPEVPEEIRGPFPADLIDQAE